MKITPDGRCTVALHGTQGEVVETSPLGRARQTAVLIAELGLAADAVVVSPLLVEHDLASGMI